MFGLWLFLWETTGGRLLVGPRQYQRTILRLVCFHLRMKVTGTYMACFDHSFNYCSIDCLQLIMLGLLFLFWTTVERLCFYCEWISPFLIFEFVTIQEGEKSEETKKLRARVSDGCEQQIWRFFEAGNGQVVIYDANNGTRESRQQLAEKFDKKGIHVIFLGTFFFPKKIVQVYV